MLQFGLSDSSHHDSQGENMKKTFSFVLGSALIMGFCAAAAIAGETQITYNDLPAAVQKTAQRESQGATVWRYSKEVENGKVEYEVEMTAGGKSRDISINPSGKVVEIEQQVSLNTVPVAAMTAIRKEAAGASIRKVEEVRANAEIAYEAQILSNGKRQEIRVHADGSAAPERN
ncbi:PepSY-like domain-containing protein [Alloacidobacterium dinghuense]|uniref:PepSY-like domain-containing protein n=1 Tax=Alloacidobacterium dinghuense TaxID=2763107 RepID=A0A7G8BD40_9BACT|nr:PepSY-like domain-containing protein [Alloacidobacterium dinghuense]QNI30460.1 PepSY-like domain-containing protein [Alloacidobacterium dinghuense]